MTTHLLGSKLPATFANQRDLHKTHSKFIDINRSPAGYWQLILGAVSSHLSLEELGGSGQANESD